jgi:cytidylate kinase
MTEAEKAAQEKNEKIAEIKANLEEIDRKDGPRPIREAVSQMADGVGLDTSYLMRHETEAQALRQELAALMTA